MTGHSEERDTMCVDDHCAICGEYESECECAALATPAADGSESDE